MNGIVPKGPHVNKQGVKLQQKLESLYGGQCQHLQSLRITRCSWIMSDFLYERICVNFFFKQSFHEGTKDFFFFFFFLNSTLTLFRDSN